jgi:RNA polymerase sigma-70 factor (ECF subfamily)
VAGEAISLNGVIGHLRRAVLPGADDVTDGRLLDEFRARRDESAFTALLRRHGPMVLGVCRRVLRQQQDAEDAFQATFLVLARKAASIRTQAVGNWLYGVAYRTAMKAKTMTAKRRVKELQAGLRPRPDAAEDWQELLPLLDRELSRLPERYRAPVVLCELEGKSRKEAAAQLGLPEGTLSSRLARGRALLARRLGGRAPAAVGVLALAREASAGVPAGLLGSTAAAATGTTTGRVGELAGWVLKGMLLNKLLGITALVVALALVALGGGVGAYQSAVGQGEVTKRGAADGGAKTNQQTPRERELKLLEGTWEMIAVSSDGKKQNTPAGRTTRLTFRGEEFTLERDGKVIARGTLKVDPSKKPRALDLTFTEGDMAGKTTLAIYEIKGDELQEGFAITGNKRPTGFTTEKGNNRLVFTYRRVKPGDGKEDPVRQELKRLEGTWEQVASVVDGEAEEFAEGVRNRVMIRGNSYTWESAGQPTSQGTLKVDPGKKPRAIDLTVREGPDKGETYRGIYELSGDELQICSVPPGGARPTAFTAGLDSGRSLSTFRRVKPEDGKEDPVRQELKLLEGTWEVVSVVADDKQQDHGKPIHITIRGDRFTAERLGTPTGKSLIGKGSLKVDPSKKLKAIDFLTTEGPGKGTKALMLYEWKGEELRLCEARPDETRKDLPRPTAFSAEPGSGRVITTLRRKAP